MKCKNCNTDNNENVRYCRNCGTFLYDEQSIIDKYPEFNFAPTSVFKPKGNPLWLPSILLCLSAICCGIYLITTRRFTFNPSRGEFYTFLAIFILPLAAIFLNKWVNQFNATKFADYIETQPKTKKYSIIVKNKKFGLLNTYEKRIQIPCQYDFLSWSTPGMVLNAVKNESHLKCDIYGNKLA